MSCRSTVLGGLAIIFVISLALPLQDLAQTPPRPEEGRDLSYAHYCRPGYEIYDPEETRCDPAMFRDLYKEGITELDIFEAWSCHGSSNRPGISGCAEWSDSTAGFIVIRGDEVTFRDAGGTHEKLADNDLSLGNGIYYCCYTRRGQRALSEDPHNPLKRPPPPYIPGDGWDRLGEVPRPIVLP